MEKFITNIKKNLFKFKNTAVEKNGQYLYMTKDNKRTSIKVKITKDTEDIKDPVDLFEYYIRCNNDSNLNIGI